MHVTFTRSHVTYSSVTQAIWVDTRMLQPPLLLTGSPKLHMGNKRDDENGCTRVNDDDDNNTQRMRNGNKKRTKFIVWAVLNNDRCMCVRMKSWALHRNWQEKYRFLSLAFKMDDDSMRFSRWGHPSYMFILFKLCWTSTVTHQTWLSISSICWTNAFTSSFVHVQRVEKERRILPGRGRRTMKIISLVYCQCDNRSGTLKRHFFPQVEMLCGWSIFMRYPSLSFCILGTI